MERAEERYYPRGKEAEDLQVAERPLRSKKKDIMDGEKKYFSLRETEKETGVPASTLRYWEKQFAELNPRKDGHGNRYYTREDQDVIKRIRYIRDEMKITRIEAIQKELRGNTRHSDERQSAVEILTRVREELCEIRKLIK